MNEKTKLSQDYWASFLVGSASISFIWGVWESESCTYCFARREFPRLWDLLKVLFIYVQMINHFQLNMTRNRVRYAGNRLNALFSLFFLCAHCS